MQVEFQVHQAFLYCTAENVGSAELLLSRFNIFSSSKVTINSNLFRFNLNLVEDRYQQLYYTIQYEQIPVLLSRRNQDAEINLPSTQYNLLQQITPTRTLAISGGALAPVENQALELGIDGSSTYTCAYDNTPAFTFTLDYVWDFGKTYVGNIYQLVASITQTNSTHQATMTLQHSVDGVTYTTLQTLNLAGVTTVTNNTTASITANFRYIRVRMNCNNTAVGNQTGNFAINTLKVNTL